MSAFSATVMLLVPALMPNSSATAAACSGVALEPIDFTRRNSAASDNSLDHGFGHISASDESKFHKNLLVGGGLQ